MAEDKQALNLWDELPWIPCIQDGVSRRHTLKSLFDQAEKITDLDIGSATKRTSLWLTLISFCASAVIREDLDIDDWSLNQVRDYLEVHREWFNLKGERRAFFQQPLNKRLLEKKKSSIYTLEPEEESGNNQSFFTQSWDPLLEPYSPEKLALCLMEAHWFGVGGLGGGYPKAKENFKDCPAARPLVVIIKGKNLVETLNENVTALFPRNIKPLKRKAFIPIWEREDSGFSLVEGTVDLGALPIYLTMGCHRNIQLEWEGTGARYVRNARGLAADDEAIGRFSLFSTVRDDTGMVRKIKADPKRDVWRDLHSILAHLNFRHSPYEFGELRTHFVLEIVGLVANQAKISGVVQSVFSLPKVFLLGDDEKEVLLGHMHSCLQHFEKQSRIMWARLSEAAERGLQTPTKRADKGVVRSMLDRSAAFDTYWDRCSVHFYQKTLPGLMQDPLLAVQAANKEAYKNRKHGERIFLGEFPKGPRWYKAAGFLHAETKRKNREVKLVN